ncbi:hypothetical protein BKA93DRAFT_121240 [Sparassis latifolia]
MIGILALAVVVVLCHVPYDLIAPISEASSTGPLLMLPRCMTIPDYQMSHIRRNGSPPWSGYASRIMTLVHLSKSGYSMVAMQVPLEEGLNAS